MTQRLRVFLSGVFLAFFFACLSGHHSFGQNTSPITLSTQQQPPPPPHNPPGGGGGTTPKCKTPPPNQYRLAPNQTIYVSYDASLGNIPPATGAGGDGTGSGEITYGVDQWGGVDNIGINFVTASAAHPATWIIEAQLTKNDYSGVAAVTYAPAGVVTPTPQNPVRTVFYPNQSFSDGTPVFNHAASNYSIVYVELTLHEMGHLLGLDDLANDASSGTAGSVMEQGAGQNLSAFSLPVGPTSCDVTEVKTASTQTPPPYTGGSSDTPTEGSNPGTCSGATPSCSNGSAAYCNAGAWDCPDSGCTGSPGECPNGSSQECDGGVWSCPSVTSSQCTGSAPSCPSGETASCENSAWQCVSDGSCSDECDPSCSNYDPSACGSGSCSDECDPDCSNYNPADCEGGGGGGGGDNGGCDYPDEGYCDVARRSLTMNTALPMGVVVLVLAIPAFTRKRNK